MRCEIVHDAQGFGALSEGWDELGHASGTGLFLSYTWLAAWWRAFRGVDELWVLALRDGERLVAGWPLHLRAPRSGPFKVSELRVLGDLGGAERSIVVPAAEIERAAEAFVERLLGERGWDLLETPVVNRQVADALGRALVGRGGQFDTTQTVARAYVDLPSAEGWPEFARLRRPVRSLEARYEEVREVTHGLDELHRLLRKEWAAREAASPVADPQVIQFLADVVPTLHARGQARVGLLIVDDTPIGADLVVVDRERQVQLLRASDPEHAPAAAVELTLGSLASAARAGARRFELDPSDLDSPFRTGQARVTRLRMWNVTAVARLHRGVSSLRGVAEAWSPRRTGPVRPHLALRALDRLRGATPEVVQRALARVAAYSTLHLYRGELFVRDVRPGGELSLRLFTRADFEALPDPTREQFAARLDLQLGYCRQKWDRGDLVVLAEVQGRPAGIVWCARSAVYVPDIGREVRPAVGECYIHDVYVHPEERGRQVAPAMLDFLARELRSRDIYRAWALIERTNTPSTRAFEKAAYASVADVIYARMGLASRLVVRPPDPEARAFLGLP
jgi:ribosomal protein S18 acetylase RimI-like enzyme